MSSGASLDELMAASARRSAHELREHDYHHQRLDDHPKPRVLSAKEIRDKRAG